LFFLSSFPPAPQHQHNALPFFRPSQPLSPSSVRGVVVLAVGAVVAAARPRRLIERKRLQNRPRRILARYTKIHSNRVPEGSHQNILILVFYLRKLQFIASASAGPQAPA
jgi:hypothetical protein